jgi:hypothetical protein
MTPAVQTSPVAVPPDVAAFAAEQGVSEYLPAVIEMTRRVYPDAALSVVVEDDPEIANDRHIVLIGQFHAETVEQALERNDQWTRGLFASCPAPLVCVFRSGMEWKP